MLDAFIDAWSAWWRTVPPAFAFLLAVPFTVAAVGLLEHAWRDRRRRADGTQKARP